MKKKIVSIMLTAAMTISMLAGCGSTSDNSSESTGGNTEKAADADSSGDEVTLNSCPVRLRMRQKKHWMRLSVILKKIIQELKLKCRV